MRKAKKTEVLYVRIPPAELKEFDECLTIDADLHDGVGERSIAVRTMVREFCRRTRSIMESETAVAAAKVLRKKARG